MRALAALLLAVSCGANAGGSGCDDLRGLPINFAVDWATQIKPIINEAVSPDGRCTSCHTGAGYPPLDLTDTGADAIYKIVDGYYVVAGRPQDSLLFSKINCTQPSDFLDRMPLGGPYLTIERQGLIYDWIAQGALGEPVDDPILPRRNFVFRDGSESLR